MKKLYHTLYRRLGAVLLLLITTSLCINVLLIGIFIYKVHNNWFEQTVLKLPFRQTIFNSAPVKPGLIYFIGDSHTEGFELNEYLNNCSVRNRGIWGDVSASVLKRVDKIAASQPSKVFLLIGVNDVCSGISPEKVANNVRLIVAKFHCKVYLQSVLPTDQKYKNASMFTTIKRLNEMYTKIPNVTFIDLFPYFEKDNALNKKYSFDGLHLNGEGYLVWSKLLAPYLAN